jgi:hypothetical protein
VYRPLKLGGRHGRAPVRGAVPKKTLYGCVSIGLSLTPGDKTSVKISKKPTTETSGT